MTENSQLVGRLTSLTIGDPAFNISQYVVPVYFVQQSTGPQYVRAVPCIQKYAGASQSLLD